MVVENKDRTQYSISIQNNNNTEITELQYMYVVI